MGFMAAEADAAGDALSRNFNRTYETRINRTYSGTAPPDSGDGEPGGYTGGTTPPVDFTAASGFYSAKMPRGDRPEGMTYLGVHPGERVSVTPAAQTAPARPAAPTTIVLQVGREVLGRIVTDLARSGHVQIPDHAVTANL